MTSITVDDVDDVGRQPLALAGVIGPVLFMITVTIASFMRADHSQIRDPISDLGNGPHAWLQNANFAAFGALLLCFTVAFHRGMRSMLAGWTLVTCTVLLALSASGFVAAAYFRVPAADASEAVRVRDGMLHGLSFMLIFVPLIAVLVMVGLRLVKDATWEMFGWYSVATGAVAVVLIALIFRFANPQSPVQLGGLLTRLLVCQTFAWHVVLGWHLAASR